VLIGVSWLVDLHKHKW